MTVNKREFPVAKLKHQVLTAPERKQIKAIRQALRDEIPLSKSSYETYREALLKNHTWVKLSQSKELKSKDLADMARYWYHHRSEFTPSKGSVSFIEESKPTISEPTVKGVAQTSHDNNTVMIPVKIKHKTPEPKPEPFVDEDRLFVHIHNLFAELVAVAKEIAQTEKSRLETEKHRHAVQAEQLKIQIEQLSIQKAMYQKATEKK